MTTRAFHEKGEAGSRALHAECRELLSRVRDEIDEAIVPLSAFKTGAIACTLMFLVWGLWLVPIYFKGSFSASHLAVAILWGGLAGLLAYLAMRIQKMSREVSNYLYLRLVELRNAFPDLEGLRYVGMPLTLGVLRHQLFMLMHALQSDIEHPARNTFRHKEGDAIEFFSFQNYSDKNNFS